MWEEFLDQSPFRNKQMNMFYIFDLLATSEISLFKQQIFWVMHLRNFWWIKKLSTFCHVYGVNHFIFSTYSFCIIIETSKKVYFHCNERQITHMICISYYFVWITPSSYQEKSLVCFRLWSLELEQKENI